ncbi:MAG: fatty acid desaturase [Vitreoscilla sp.]|nr:fatty acid desaturase [Vitreoscilla sp.]
MAKQWLRASLSLSMFVVPMLPLAGIALNTPSLAFWTVILVLPLARRFVGKVQANAAENWDEGVATWLDRLPLLYAVVLLGCTALVLRHLALASRPSPGQAVGLGLSLWMTLLFATCVAHELIHRRDPRQAMVGHCIAGLSGYPLLGSEHLRHHARAGATQDAEWPRADESVWWFAYRRAMGVFARNYGSRSAFWSAGASGRHVYGLRAATSIALITCSLFALAGGWMGLVIYLGSAVSVAFGMQLFTYIQHWGLGDDRLGERSSQGFGWEDDCRLQAWMTLGISLHHAHHQSTSRPYYNMVLTADSPRLPAGYVVLMFLCLFPQQWRKAMKPALEHWERYPDDPRSPGRDLTCFNKYSDRRTPPVSP